MAASSAARAGSAGRLPAPIAAGGVLALTLGIAVWPAFTLLLVAVGIVAALAGRAPSEAFLLTLGLFGFEGTIKALLTAGETPLTASPNAVGAAALDLALAVATAGLILARRHALRDLWHGAGRLGRVGLALLGAWLAVSVPQILQSGDLAQGASGFRLTQWYALAAVAGALLLARGGDRALSPLLAVLSLAAGYAALRAVLGPSELERGFALTRAQGAPEYGDVFRTVGSFSSAVALASFLVPVAGFAFGLALLGTRRRALAGLGFAAATIGVLGSYTRVALVAIAAGTLVVALLGAVGAIASTRRRLAAAGVVLAVLVAGGTATAVASRASPELRERANAFLHPLDDPSVRMRLKTWKDAARSIARQPFGAGLGTVGRATESSGGAVTIDNSYLKIVREQGVAVGALFVLGLAVTLVALVRDVLRAGGRSRGLGAAALAGCAAFLVLAAAGEYVEQPGKVVFWTLLGLAAWVAWSGRTDPRRA